MNTPKNLLHDIRTRDEIKAIMAAHPRRPLVPPLDAEAWKKAAANPLLQPLARAMRARAEAELERALPALTTELYAVYSQTGSRWEFETVYFERRRRLARAALSLLLSKADDPARPRLAQSLLAKLSSILDEPAWAFPAHVKPARAVPGQDPWEIDLFGAESANLMAELLDYFGAIIPADLRDRMLDRVRRQYWENYLVPVNGEPFWWMTHSNNWNAVCHQGVLGSALAACDDDELLADMLFKAKGLLPTFLSGFGADGGSSEGPGYWDYGFGWFAVLNEQLETRTDGGLSVFAGDSHVTEIARFGPRGSFSHGLLVCFSDSPPIGILRPSTLRYLGDRLDDGLCRDQALTNYALKLAEPINLDFQRADLFYFGRYFLQCPAELPKAAPVTTDKNIYLPDLAVLIAAATDAHGHLWEIAAKAGHNDEHHNHNDCGNYILNIDGHRFITDIGQPLYDKDFFGPKRYENLAARSLSHSLPVINGHEQAAGRAHESKLIEYADTPEEVRFRVDLAACYPKEARVRRLIRTLRFEKSAGRLAVQDEFELEEARAAETAVIAIHPVKIAKDSATISSGGINLVLHPEPGTVLAGVEEHKYRHHDPTITTPVAIQRLVLKPVSLGPKFTLGFVARLA
jgi:hypothetical protein